jgi:hypothetical protein
MATTPTDDPLANSDRTVGVRWNWGAWDLNNIKALKREALLFDQIAFRLNLDTQDNLDGVVKLELNWLQDKGIVRSIFPEWHGDDPLADRDFLAATVAETREPIDIMAIPDNLVRVEVQRQWIELYHGPDFAGAVLCRKCSIDLRRQGINAFPILENRRQIVDVFPSGTAPVLEVVLKSMPIPDD